MKHIEELIEGAYQKTRSLIYHDRSNLETRRLFAELGENVEKMEELTSELTKVLTNPHDLSSESLFFRAIEEITLEIRPKSFQNENLDFQEGSLNLISNIDTHEFYNVEKFNYFIICHPILHILSTMWVMTAGPILEKNFSETSYGSRLHKEAANSKSKKLFRYYPADYAQWRDTAISRTKRAVSIDRQNATIVGLDIKEFYYHANFEWNILYDQIVESGDFCKEIQIAANLTKKIQCICEGYRKILLETSENTHPDISELKTPLPIGLNFSPVIANWILCDFDKSIQDDLNPLYYGRYIDDMLFVISSRSLPTTKEGKTSGQSFLYHYFTKRKLLTETTDTTGNRVYALRGSPSLFIQPSKIRIQHFDKEGTLAPLDKFKKTINEIASEFRSLPEPLSKSKIEELTQDLQYSGSIQNLRSIKGFSVNKWRLSQILTSSAITRLVASDPKRDKEESESLAMLFQGRLGIEMYDMWEKLFAVFAIGQQYSQLKKIYWDLNFRINKIKVPLRPGRQFSMEADLIAKKVRSFLHEHLDLSLSMTISLIGSKSIIKDRSWTSKRDLKILDKISTPSRSFRKSNLLRHHYIGTPLLNFFPVSDDNMDEKWTLIYDYFEGVGPDESPINDSPRYIHKQESDHAEILAKSWEQAANHLNIAEFDHDQ